MINSEIGSKYTHKNKVNNVCLLDICWLLGRINSQNTAQKTSVGHIYIHTHTHKHTILAPRTERQTELLAWPWSHSFPSPAIHLSSYLYLSCFFSQKGLLDPQGLFSRPLSILCCSFPLSLTPPHTLFLSIFSLMEVINSQKVKKDMFLNRLCNQNSPKQTWKDSKWS